MGISGGSDVKNLPARRETQVLSLGWEDTLEKGTATHSSILACRVPKNPMDRGAWWATVSHKNVEIPWWSSGGLGSIPAQGTEIPPVTHQSEKCRPINDVLHISFCHFFSVTQLWFLKLTESNPHSSSAAIFIFCITSHCRTKLGFVYLFL